MNSSENAPGGNKSKMHTQGQQTKTDYASGPELVEQPDAAGTSLSVKDRRVANHQQKPRVVDKRKVSWRNIPWEFLILWSPLPLLIVLLVTDPTAHHLIQSRLAKTNAQRIEHYTNALNIRKDPEVLVRRASALGATDPAAEFSDLKEATQRGANSGEIYWQMATARANDKGIDKETVDLLRKSAEQSAKHFKAFPIDVTSDANSFCRSIYGLIACGEFKDAKNLLQAQPHTFYGHGERTFFRALLKKEAGDLEGASADLTEADGNVHAPYYSDPACFQVLLALDANDGKGASDQVEYVSGYKATDWLTDYVAAWAAYKNGDLKGAQHQATKVIISFDAHQPGIVGLNGIAASHLLKAEVFAKQGRMKQATTEFEKYTECKSKGYTGRLFIPMPYRKWIYEKILAATRK